ncbi:MAG TPA: hypothetical protein PLH27_10720 [bacterium]|nr:hypothetical protein [bacterium]
MVNLTDFQITGVSGSVEVKHHDVESLPLFRSYERRRYGANVIDSVTRVGSYHIQINFNDASPLEALNEYREIIRRHLA